MADTKKITVIVPLHKFDDEVKTLLTRAIDSVNKKLCEVIFVGPNDVLLEAKSVCDDATLVVNNEDSDVFTQINKAVLQCVTPYFSILEYDDVYLGEWSNIMLDKLSEKTIILPINEYRENGTFRGFGNEIAWDAAFISEGGEIGYIGEGELRLFSDFNVTGGIIKTEDFISVGCLKPEFKVLTWYEFLMRVARSGKKIYVLPRVHYSHTVLREGSYMVEAKNSVTDEEISELLKQILG